MTKFLFIYRINNGSFDNMSPEEVQQNLQRWQTWIAQGIEKGWLLDAGDGLHKEGRVVNAKKIVSDGPFVEAKEIVGGFSIIQADTLDAATEFAKGCPVLLRGGTVEVRPLRGYNMGK
jgi:hypothetical protein